MRALIALLLLTSAVAGGESLLKNPALTGAREFRQPDGCFAQPGGQRLLRFRYDDNRKLIIRMESASAVPIMRLGLIGDIARIGRSGDRVATISCEIRGDVQSETGPAMFLEFRGKFGQGSRIQSVLPMTDGKRQKLDGSFAWRPFRFSFTIPDLTEDICVMLQLRNVKGWVEWRDPAFELTPDARPETLGIAPFLTAEAALEQARKKESARFARRRAMYEKTLGPLPAPDALYRITPRLSEPHPRLLPGQLTLAELRRRAADPAYARFTEQLRRRAEEAIKRKPVAGTNLWTEDPLRGIANRLQYLSLAAAVDPDPAARRRFTAETVKLADELIALGTPRQDLPLAHLVIGLCRAYDLLYAELPEAARAKMRDFIVTLVRYSRDPRLGNFTMWRYEQFTANHNWFNYAQQGLAAMTLWDDPKSLAPREELKRWLDEAVENFYMVEKTHPEDGFSMEGAMYQDYGLRSYFDFAWPAERLLALKYPILDSPYFRNLHARLHTLLPDRQGFAPYSDARGPEMTGYSAFFWAAARFNNPQAQLLGNVMFENDKQRGMPAHASEWRALESYDPKIAAAGWEDLPLFYNGDSLGLYTVRSDWGTSGAMMLLRCGTPVGKPCRKNFGITVGNGHLAPQQGEVLFFIGSDPVLAATEYPHMKVTSNHNLAVIEGKSPLQPAWLGQTGEGGAWFEGGRFFMRDTIREPAVAELKNTAGYSTYLCDLGGAYVIHQPQGRPQKLYPQYWRRVVFLPQGAVVIADKLTLPVERKVRFRLLTAGDSLQSDGRDATLAIKDRRYLLRDFSPAEHRREVTREILNCDGNRNRHVFNLTAPAGREAFFAVAAGRPDVVEKLRVESVSGGLNVTLPDGKVEFFPWR